MVAHLQSLPWPGNVRQLENACRWLTVMAPGQEVQLGDLPPELSPPSAAAGAAGAPPPAAVAPALPSAEICTRAVETVERTLIEAALRATGGQRQEAARRLGWGRNTLTRKIQSLGLE